MQKILVTYITNSGTTTGVAEAIAEELTKAGKSVDVLPLSEVDPATLYDGVVLGAPMIIGWHRSALTYLKRHKSELAKKPLALFMTGMSLVESQKPAAPGVEIHVDPKLILPPKKPGKLDFKERFTTLHNYLSPVLKVAPQSLKGIALFGGRLDMYRLKWFEVLFVMIVVGAKPGEKRNWEDIRAWASGLPALMEN